MKKTSVKTNLILVFLALAISEVLVSVFEISEVYGEMFLSGVAANVFLALFEVVFIYGLLSAVITYVAIYVLYLIIRRASTEIEKDYFIFNVLLFTMIANLICAVLYAFNFLNDEIYVFLQYICPVAVNGVAYILMTHFTVLKKTTQNRHAVFLNTILPYFVWKLLGYFSNVILYVSQDRYGEALQDLGLTLTFDPNEKTAIIIGAVLLAAFLIYICVTYYLLSKKPNSGGNQTVIEGTVEENDKVFDDFDV
ncbi:MAG: hypothetical protein ACI4MT_02590 [Christensenellales bacterium]